MERLPPAVLVALGVIAAALVWAAWAALARWLRRHRGLARQRHGAAGEKRGAALLERAGWRVLAAHPAAELELTVDGEAFGQPLEADYLCERDGRTLPAEVKTGQAADLAARTTRRQLLEYAVGYGGGATLFVDADAGTVTEVRFPSAPAAPRGRGGRARAVAAALALGTLAGVAAGYWLWGARP